MSKTGNNKLTFLVIFKLTFLVKIILTILNKSMVYLPLFNTILILIPFLILYSFFVEEIQES